LDEHTIIKVKEMMTYSIRHGKGKDGQTSLRRIAEEIAEAHPDVVTLQGVDRFLPRSGFQDQLNRLGKQLGMYSCFSPSSLSSNTVMPF
jgi:endonuclease/exonuclease/phosphatase family metal-dependent hydrolase